MCPMSKIASHSKKCHRWIFANFSRSFKDVQEEISVTILGLHLYGSLQNQRQSLLFHRKSPKISRLPTENNHWRGMENYFGVIKVAIIYLSMFFFVFMTKISNFHYENGTMALCFFFWKVLNLKYTFSLIDKLITAIKHFFVHIFKQSSRVWAPLQAEAEVWTVWHLDAFGLSRCSIRESRYLTRLS